MKILGEVTGYPPNRLQMTVNETLTYYVLSTVHIGVILFNGQLDASFIFVYVYLNSVHVSSIQVLIIRRFNFINTISGICHSM